MTNKDQTPEPQRPVIKGKTIYNDKPKPPKTQPKSKEEEDDGIDPILWDVVQRGLARFAREAEDRERRIFYQKNPHIKPQVPRVLIEEAMAQPSAPPKHKPVQSPKIDASPTSAFPNSPAQFNPPKNQGQQNPAHWFLGGTIPKSAADPFAGTRQSNAYGVPDHHFEVQEPKDKLHSLGLPDDANKLSYNPQGIKPKDSYGQQGFDMSTPKGAHEQKDIKAREFQPGVWLGPVDPTPAYQTPAMMEMDAADRQEREFRKEKNGLLWTLDEGEIPTTKQLDRFFSDYYQAMRNAKTSAERKRIQDTLVAYKERIVQNMIGPKRLEHNEGYPIINGQTYGKQYAERAARKLLEHWQATGQPPEHEFPTDPNQLDPAKHDVTQRFNQLIRGMAETTKEIAYREGKIQLNQYYDKRGVYGWFHKNFKNGGAADTQVIAGMPTQSVLYDKNGNPAPDPNYPGCIKTQDQWAIYKGKPVMAGYLSNYAFGYAAAAGRLYLDQKSAEDASFHPLNEVGNVVFGVADRNSHINPKLHFNPKKDYQAIIEGWYGYYKDHPEIKPPKGPFDHIWFGDKEQ